MLELAVASLNVDYGLITQIDTETDHWEVVITTDQTGEVIPPDLERDLQKTYCRKTVTDEGPHAIHDAIAEGWADDPALETRDHHTYLGIPLIPEDTPYGTVCFESEDSREQPFTETETLFADHVTRLIERELKRERIEDELAGHTNFAAVMNRVLRHNLRNNITVLRGRIQLLAESTDEVDAIEDVFDYIDEIIDLSEKARKLERIITADTESHTIAIESLIEEITGEVAREHPEASIAFEYDESITATVRKDFDLAITELLENAVKHSGEQSTVSVSIEKQPNTFEIEISDDGPGLPKMEAEVLSTGRESPLTHGSGLGLWTVHWIVSQHDGSIDTHVTDEGTTISISIPRQPEVQIAQNRSEIIRGRDRFQAAFKEAHDSIVILDNDARVINCNAAAADLFGTDEQALLGQPLRAYAVDQSEFDAKWRHFQTSGTNRDEMMFVDTDGAERIVEYSGQNDIIPGEHVFVARDITERREREAQIQQERDRFRSVFDGAFDAMVIANDAGEIIDLNDSATALYDREKEEITGHSIREFTPESFDFRESWEEFQQSGQDRGEFPLLRSDGSIRHVEYAATTDFIQGQHLSILRDITERKEREQELEQAEAVFQNTQDALFLIDVVDGSEFRIRRVNDAYEDTTGLTSTELTGKTPREAVGDEIGSEIESRYRESVERQEILQYVEEIPVDGESRFWETKLTPLIQDGSVTQLVGATRDITERRGREQELRETNSLLSTLYETAPVGVTVLNTDGEFIRANDHAEAVLGLSKSKITGRTYNDPSWELFGEDGEAVPDEELPFAQVMATEEPMYEKELGIRWPNGTERWLSINLAPLKTESGEIDRVVAVISDITEQRERKRELTALKERYETLLEAAPDPVFVAEAETGEIIDVNEAAESLIGAPQQELIGRHYSTFHPPEDADMYRKTFDRIAGERTTVQQLPDGSRPEVLTADGDTIPIEMSVDTVSLPDGEVIFGIFRDISDRVEREAELRAKTRAMDEAPIGITLTDPHKDDNPMIYTNQKFVELTGYQKDEIIGRNCRFVQGEETDPETVAEIRSAIDNQQSVSTTIRNYRKDGTPFWNRVQIAPVMDESGEITNWVGFQEDLTERKDREETFETLQ